MEKIGFIGTGNMGSALLEAIYKKNISRDIIAYDPNEQKLIALRDKYGIKKAARNADVVNYADVVFLAVKPFHVAGLLDEIKPYAKKHHLFVSIAAGINLQTLQSKLKNIKIIRVMPNAPCIVGEMAAGFALGKHATEEDSKLIKKILDSAGISFEVKEELLDAITGLSGSGPAFVAYLIQAFIAGGKKIGIAEHIATGLAEQTFFGTAKLLKESSFTEEELIKIVSTKGGTTEAGMEILKNSGIREVIIKAIEHATKRSKELGK